MSTRLAGTIRRWTTKGWGIANSYAPGSTEPTRWFIHANHAVTDEIENALGLNVRITFEEGPPRNPGELPTALKIELAPNKPTSQIKRELAQTQAAPTNEPISGSSEKETSDDK